MNCVQCVCSHSPVTSVNQVRCTNQTTHDSIIIFCLESHIQPVLLCWKINWLRVCGVKLVCAHFVKHKYIFRNMYHVCSLIIKLNCSFVPLSYSVWHCVHVCRFLPTLTQSITSDMSVPSTSFSVVARSSYCFLSQWSKLQIASWRCIISVSLFMMFTWINLIHTFAIFVAIYAAACLVHARVCS